MANSAAKTLLKNYIRHVGSHNKIVEEAEMWKEYHRTKEFEKDNRYSFLQDKRVDMNEEFSHRRNKRAHMDEEPESTFCLRQLYKAEENDPDRWGHSGYKELYPKDLDSDRSEEEKTYKKPMKMRKKGKKKNKEKKRKKRKKHYTSDSDLEFKRSKKQKKHLKRKKTKAKNYNSDTESDYKITKDSNNLSLGDNRKRKHTKYVNVRTEKYDDSESPSKRTKHSPSENHLVLKKTKSNKKHKKKSHASSDSEISDSEFHKKLKRNKRKTDCDDYDDSFSSESRSHKKFNRHDRESVSHKTLKKPVSDDSNSQNDRPIKKWTSVKTHRKKYRSYSSTDSSDSD